MKRFWFGLLWLAAFAAAGSAAGHRYIPPIPLAFIVVSGAAAGRLVGGLLFLFLAGLNVLPGARLGRGAPVRWGVAQAAWMVVQFFTMQVATQFLVVLVLAAGIGAMLAAHGAPVGAGLRRDLAGLGFLPVLATAAGYLAAGWWSVWYIGRLGSARFRDGSPTGIAWRPAPRVAYLAALGCLAVVGAAGALVQMVDPPDKAAEAHNMIVLLFGHSPWKLAVLFVLAAGLAPFLEELVFRGGMIAALSPRLGAFWAAVATSVVFTACHAEEGLTYHAGLLVILCIAVALAWLRLKYQSIRPGILLHVLFNGFSVLALAFTR